MKKIRIALIGCGAQAKYASEIFRLMPNTQVTHVLSPEDVTELEWLSHYDGEHVKGYSKIENLSHQNEIDAAIVCVAKAVEKKRLYQTYICGKIQEISAIHPRAQIASSANIGANCLINAGAVIQPLATIGTGVMIHANVIVEHDCTVADWVNLAPGSQLAGWVSVGEGATVFTGASVTPTCQIGSGAIIGAGATVISNIPAGETYVGVPAKPLVQKNNF